MNGPLFVEILEKSLLPFLKERLPDSHRFMQDNDPKHTSRCAQSFFEAKEYLRREIKPHSKQELIDGILKFWKTVTIPKCRKYINHLHKVIPKVIELKG